MPVLAHLADDELMAVHRVLAREISEQAFGMAAAFFSDQALLQQVRAFVRRTEGYILEHPRMEAFLRNLLIPEWRRLDSRMPDGAMDARDFLQFTGRNALAAFRIMAADHPDLARRVGLDELRGSADSHVLVKRVLMRIGDLAAGEIEDLVEAWREAHQEVRDQVLQATMKSHFRTIDDAIHLDGFGGILNDADGIDQMIAQQMEASLQSLEHDMQRLKARHEESDREASFTPLDVGRAPGP